MTLEREMAVLEPAERPAGRAHRWLGHKISPIAACDARCADPDSAHGFLFQNYQGVRR